MNGKTKKRRVLVTGAGSGFGLAIAGRMAEAGDLVTGTVRDPDRAASLTRPGLSYLPLNLTSPESIARLSDELMRDGGIDVLVHNAGFAVFGPVEEVGAEAASSQFATHILGPLELTRKLLPGLRARRGRIIWIGSLGGRMALPFQAHYSASKFAIAALSDAMRMELRPFGVAVTCVEPGDFRTGLTEARVAQRSPDSPYADASEECLRAINEQERGGPGPRWVAEVVLEVSRQASPPARRPVGRWARTMCLLNDFLPTSIRERLVMRNYRLDG